MYTYGILIWYGYLRLGHNPFLSSLVTFLSCLTRAYPLSFHLVSGVLVFSLVIYWHFLDVTLRHIPSSFVLRCLISCLFKSFSGVLMFILGHTPSFLASPVLARTLLQYLPRFDPPSVSYSPVLAWIWSLLRYSPEPFSGTHSESSLLRYSPGFYPFLVLARIQSLLDTCPDTISSQASWLDFRIFSNIASGFL